MRKNEDVLKYVYLAVIGLVAMIGAIFLIRKNLQIAVVICVFLFLFICFLAAFRFHTHRRGGFQITPREVEGPQIGRLPFTAAVPDHHRLARLSAQLDLYPHGHRGHPDRYAYANRDGYDCDCHLPAPRACPPPGTERPGGVLLPASYGRFDHPMPDHGGKPGGQ